MQTVQISSAWLTNNVTMTENFILIPPAQKSRPDGRALPPVFPVMRDNTFLLRPLKERKMYLVAAVIYQDCLMSQIPKPVHNPLQAGLRIQHRYNHNIFHVSLLLSQAFCLLFFTLMPEAKGTET